MANEFVSSEKRDTLRTARMRSCVTMHGVTDEFNAGGSRVAVSIPEVQRKNF